MKTLKLKTNKKTGESYFNIKDLKLKTPLAQIKYYTVEVIVDERPDGTVVNTLLLTFFNKNRKVISLETGKKLK